MENIILLIAFMMGIVLVAIGAYAFTMATFIFINLIFKLFKK